MSKSQPKQMNFGRGPRMSGPVEKATNPMKTIRSIWAYVQRQKIGMVFAIVFVILSTILNLVGHYLIGHMVDEYVMKLDISGTIRMSMILGSVFVAASIFTWLQTFVMIRVSLKTIFILRYELFKKLQSLGLPFFDRHAIGDLMSRATNDLDQLNTALSQSVTQIVSTVLTLIGVSIAMFSLSFQLALVTLIVIPLIVFTTKQIVKRSGKNYAARQKDLGNLNGYVEEMITGAEIITLFGKEQESISQFQQKNEQLRQSAARAEIVSGFLGPTNNFMNNIGLAAVLGAGALFAVKGSVSVGTIAAFVTYTRQFFRPINQLSNLLNTFQAAIAGAERVFVVLHDPTMETDQGKSYQPEKIQGDVRFEHVSFQYKYDKPVLKDIEFEVKKGETLALIGHTGSGKTTLIQLLNRFYPVTSGHLYIDDVNINDYALSFIRERVGVVLQDTYLFSGTVRDNIRFGKLDATDEEVMEAAKIANAHNFIKYLPEQYDTIVQVGGSNFSQGQRQLIAIARTILENPDILILDEATSSVDTQTELDIQKGLHRLMEGRTSFVIAHRLKTIENADHILVLDHGEVIERGNHQELMEKKGAYYQLQEKLEIEDATNF